MPYTVFSRLELLFCQSVSRNQGIFLHGGNLLLLCEAVVLSLRLLMVMLVWCRAAAPVECGGSLRPELAVAAFPVML